MNTLEFINSQTELQFSDSTERNDETDSISSKLGELTVRIWLPNKDYNWFSVGLIDLKHDLDWFYLSEQLTITQVIELVTSLKLKS